MNSEPEHQNQMSRDELIAENDQLRSFAYMACHDLQAPLRHIQVYIKALEENLAGEECMKVPENAYGLSVISSGAKMMSSLLESLMLLSKVEQGGLKVQEIDMNSLCAKVASTLLEAGDDVRAKKISWGRLPSIHGDEDQIFQVLMNLCANGVKYQDEDKSSVISIVVESVASAWEVSVTDNGLGIPKEEVEKIFKPFVRLQGASRFQGSGLGLSICQRIVEGHGGDIWVSSKEGEGTTFHFTISKNL